MTLLKGVILNKIPFLPLIHSEFGLGVCEAATLVHVWEVTRSAWGRRESGMGMGMEMGVWGGREAYLREPGLVIAFGHGSRDFEDDS